MPEGDSVYQLARRLEPALKGRRLVRGELRVPAHATDDLAGRTVIDLDTHGKHLLIRFDADLTLHTHLRMDGSWTVVRPGRSLPRAMLPDVRVLLAAVQGPTSYGVSIPVVELMRTADEADVIGHLGPDPLRADWDPAEAVSRLGADPGRPLAAALLDQRLVAGLGNLWANELCFLRGYSPWTPAGEVDLQATVALAARALRHSALTPGAYQVTTGRNRRGEDHWVAGRAGQPCRRCGVSIQVAEEVPGDPDRRRTWWCPGASPVPSRTAEVPEVLRCLRTGVRGYQGLMDIWERIRFARDGALKAEETERQRLADADTKELQQAASVRLATRQAVREALDDVLDEHSEPAKGKSGTAPSADQPASPATSDEPASPTASEGSEAPAVDDVKEDLGEDTGAQVSG